ncbi:diaminopimelate epimerase [Aliidongia dinghuensis]|uniref:Diaminopimelate epimerase n=1 Tax=Aliidongia dinghuensis TaxID=1867774 RepID=A0A8J2YU46_9PROT|nr:diaminopimelate epimerase [Aliidongia dinghuensis]GGF22011.1 diaminopimelate epimerase [Aliidongia dinghuensis]
MEPVPFAKMHGLGNDFVVIDGRVRPIRVSEAAAQAIGDRHTGVGFDQLIVLEPPQSADADVFMRILNSDGSEAGACGNATRCVVSKVLGESGRERIVIETISGLLPAERAAMGEITVDMGPARLDWRDVPLAEPMDTLAVPVGLPELGDATCSSMGNPHATFFVPDLDAVDMARLGPQLEHHRLFPARANIGFAQVVAPGRIRLQVWERGAGLTLACGSGACATLVAAARRGLTGRKAEILVKHGRLVIEWREDGHVLMTGPVATSFTGTLDPALFAGTN